MTSKFALVIANTEYQDARFAKLTAPGKDAEEFAHILRSPELAAFDDVQVLLNEGEGTIRRAIARFFTERKRDDLLLLYFSGHGVRNEEGQLFLAVHDTELSILEATSIRAEFVTHAMNNSRSQRQLLILDCCNSGAFAHGSKSASGIGNSMGIATAFEGNGFGRVVLTATDATQFAWEGDKVIGDTQKSVFTHFLIEGLKGEADRDGDGRIHVDELYDYAYEQVVRRTPKQTPGKWSYRQQGEIILRDNLKMQEVKPAPLPSDLLDLLSHPNPSVRRVGIQDLMSLLDGKHLGLARAAQDKLRAIAASDDSLSLRKTAGDMLNERELTLETPIDIYVMEGELEKEISSLPPREEPIEKITVQPPRHTTLPRAREKQPAREINFRLLSIASLIVVGLIFAVWGGNYLVQSRLVSSVPSEIPTIISTTDGMTLLYVPAGEFSMGSKAQDAVAECQKFQSVCPLTLFIDEEPPHPVYLDAFWIDKTEVTNAMFAQFLNERSNQLEDGVAWLDSRNDRIHLLDDVWRVDAGYENHPVIWVSWYGANAYCAWADRHLPTEAEWEKAARGTDGRIYPWRNNEPDNALLNYKRNLRGTTEVGKYLDGASPYDALDMAGNVWEWVADWYGETFYLESPSSNPSGPEIGELRVLRGGSWSGSEYLVRASYRYELNPAYTDHSIGFRCARDASAEGTP